MHLELLPLLQQIAIWLIPILFAITLHEAMHGFVAYKLGDDTAHRLGRVTLNPLKHIDLFGTLILPIFLMFTTGFLFGWAKPVPVNPERLNKPKRDFALVALAGPLSNFLMAILWMGLFKLGLTWLKGPVHNHPFLAMSLVGVQINLILMLLNLIPIPPLDGSRLISYLLPSPWDKKFNQVGILGILLILALILSGLLSKVLLPAMKFFQQWLALLFGV